MTVEEAIAEARSGILTWDWRKDQGHTLDAALRRIALAAYESMPCRVIDLMGRGTDCITLRKVLPCDRCQKVQEYSA